MLSKREKERETARGARHPLSPSNIPKPSLSTTSPPQDRSPTNQRVRAVEAWGGVAPSSVVCLPRRGVHTMGGGGSPPAEAAPLGGPGWGGSWVGAGGCRWRRGFSLVCGAAWRCRRGHFGSGVNLLPRLRFGHALFPRPPRLFLLRLPGRCWPWVSVGGLVSPTVQGRWDWGFCAPEWPSSGPASG